MVTTKIVNVVATASVNQQITFGELKKIDFIVHNSDIYRGRVAYFKDKNMDGKVSIFASGKMISIGTKSELRACTELSYALEYLVNNKIVKHVELNPQIQNVVFTSNMEQKIDLDSLAFSSDVIYEPEQFPAVILRLKKPHKSSSLIFASGKIVTSGLKSSAQIGCIIRKIQQIIEQAQ